MSSREGWHAQKPEGLSEVMRAYRSGVKAEHPSVVARNTSEG
jgi:hypothetical protein